MGMKILFVLLLCVVFSSLTESTRVSREADTGCPASVVELDVGPDTGEIRSPLYPNYYPANTTCTWKLTAPDGNQINISSEYFGLEDSAGCVFDYLIIYDGGSAEQAPNKDKYCGNSPFEIVTSTNEALLVFRSDPSYEGIGFELRYTRTSDLPKPRVARVPDCNRTFADSPGNIISPNYPLPSEDNVYCTYNFTAPEGKIIQLVFWDFHLEPSTYCKYDGLEIFDGPDSTDSELLDVYCGASRPPGVRSTTNSLFLVFYTDSWYTQHGFNFTYTFVEPDADPMGLELADKDCSRLLTDEGHVTTPNYPFMYENSKVCVNVIRAPNGMYVKLVVVEFHLEDSADCASDSLVIQDGETPDAPRIGRFCGKQMTSNTSITSTSKVLRLEFRSDGSVSEPGFQITYSFVTESDSIRCYLDCKNSGECVQQSQGPICDCMPPYSGSRCETIPQGCREEPCLNGGTCRQGEFSFSCFCLEGFTGEYCDNLIELQFQFKVAPQNQTNLPEDGPVVVQCEVNKRDARIQWVFSDDILLDKDDTNSQRLGIDVHEGGVLHITSLTEYNSGKYTCVGDDGMDQIEGHAWVTIDKPCLLDFTLSPQNTTEAALKKIHLFKCKATGGRVDYWEKDGQPIKQDAKFKVLVNGFLQVSYLEISDTGKYTCVVRGQDCAKRATAWLTVVGSGSIHQTCGRPMIALPGGVQIGARVTSGRRALEGSYPWFALLFDTVTPAAFCGATIINEKWIVTAAHCILAVSKRTQKYIFNKHTTKIFVGSNHCRGEGGSRLSVDKVIVYPDYDNATFNHDIALIKVKERMQFTSKIIPACLQPLSFIETRFLRGQEYGYVAGCGLLHEFGGKPPYLSEVKLPIRNKFECDDTSDSSAKNMICAGYATANRGDACGGDSGGGFVIKSGNQFTLVGIVSWGKGCDRKDSYGYYTNVGRYFKWIYDITDN